MPHAVYYALRLCPWFGCDFSIAMVDFQLEFGKDRQLYARVLLAWGRKPEYGIVGRCPGCQRFVWFGPDETVTEPLPPDIELLPDDWHLTASIVTHMPGGTP